MKGQRKLSEHQKRYREKFLALNPGFGDAKRNSHLGAAHELIVSGHLLKRGYSVFRSVSPFGLFDLIAIRDGKMTRVEVKTGYYSVSGSKTYSAIHNHGHYDTLAVVYSDGAIECFPPLD